MPEPVLVAITGASGAPYGVRLVERLRALKIETALVVTRHGEETLALETDESVASLAERVARCYKPDDMFAPFASGTHRARATFVAPCSANTASRIAIGVADDLVTRAAAVALKERAPLVLLVRESPLSLPLARRLVELVEAGAVVLPASPPFYNRPATVLDVVDAVCSKALACAGLPSDVENLWRP